MRKAYLIEIADIEAGVLVRDGNGYAFVAASPRFSALEGAKFSGVLAAEQAARKLYRRRPDRDRRLAA
jgi:hypothetical protein